jgi:thiol:disulfide interchange protein DsbD
MNLSGSWLDYVFVFTGGVALSFTPCVYPLLPVTASYIGISAKGSRLTGLLHSLVYVTGLAVTYSVLGLVATLTGSMFGRISSHPATRLAVGAVFVLFGISMFRAFAVYFPTIVGLSRIHRTGLWSVLILGAVSGLVASPCVAPALGAILVYLATTRNILYGTTLLIVFAYGMGLVLILVGTFSASMLHLPRSGKWMVWVERVSASVLVALGVYFIITAIGRLIS